MAKKKPLKFDDVGEEFFAKAKKAEADTIFYFRESGDFLRGELFGTQNHSLLHHTQKTYLMKVQEARQGGGEIDVKPGQVIEFPANAKLRRIIEGNELMFSRLRIVFVDRQRRYKLYQVFKDIGTYFKSEVEQNAKARRKRKTKKSPGKAKRTSPRYRRSKARSV